MPGEKITLRCDRVRPGVPTRNGNIYSRELMEQMVDQINRKAKNRSLLGKLGQSSLDRIKINEASHLVLGASLDEHGLSASIEVLDTPMGKELAKLLDSSGEFEVVPCGVGSIQEHEGKRFVQDDYSISTVVIMPKLTVDAKMTQRAKTIRIPLIVDEHGNTYVQAWAHKDCEPHQEDTEAMIEQARELHEVSFPQSKTVVIRWATIQIPLPEPAGEIEGTIQAEAVDEADD